VEAIVGAPKLMHTVLIDACTGCELCVPHCPMDCIDMLWLHELAGRGSAQAAAEASTPVAAHASRWRSRYAVHLRRTVRERREGEARQAVEDEEKLPALPARPPDDALQRKHAAIGAALARARARRAGAS
jgi:electron transport complex protein RnfB